MTLNNLGTAYGDLGEWQKALKFYEQALAASRESGDRDNEAYALHNSALEIAQLGDRAEALRRVREALAIREELRSPLTEETRQRLEWLESMPENLPGAAD